MQPPALTLRSVEAGNLASLSAGRTGRRTSSPPQFGQRPCSTPSAQPLQKVHSNEHIIASRESGGRSRSQHSQFGRSASIVGLHETAGTAMCMGKMVLDATISEAEIAQ